MNDYTSMKEEIDKLIKSGEKIHNALLPVTGEEIKCKDLSYFLVNYEPWYTKAYAVVKQLSPDRLTDFTMLYSNPRRKELSAGTYCISDALRTITHRDDFYGPWTAALCFLRQEMIVRACLETFDSKIYNMHTILQADIFDSEIESAKHLFKKGFLRAAGAICGVLIEKHFSGVCKNRGIEIKKKNPVISDYNDALKDNVYDTIEWRRIQRLGDLRNLCDHNKDREPTKEEVEELIAGTERVLKTIF